MVIDPEKDKEMDDIFEEIKTMMRSNPESLKEPLQKFIDSFHRIKSISSLGSALSTFNKYNGAAAPLKKRGLQGGNALPEVDESEKSLPRSTRCTLAQLRSGWCKLLNNYKARLDPSVADTCPLCQSLNHDVWHLFSCPSKPTTLDPTSLWTDPVVVAKFLDLETEL
ncbi:hypothetical protein M8J77_025612 [Diaphorina citri]|nr:hypothetical protein M8J77_025612 [Diaphorina citri]